MRISFRAARDYAIDTVSRSRDCFQLDKRKLKWYDWRNFSPSIDDLSLVARRCSVPRYVAHPVSPLLSGLLNFVKPRRIPAKTKDSGDSGKEANRKLWARKIEGTTVGARKLDERIESQCKSNRSFTAFEL